VLKNRFIVDFNGINFPRVNLGDRGFLKKYGSSLSNQDILKYMQFAERNNMGIASGDHNTLETAASLNTKSFIYHSYLPLNLGQIVLPIQRCQSTLYDFLYSWSPAFASNDRLVGATYTSSSHYEKVLDSDAKYLHISTILQEKEIQEILKYKPGIVTIGGDYFDLCASLNRFDIITEVIKRYKDICLSCNSKLVLLTYMGFLLYEDSWLKNNVGYLDGLMIPYNFSGVGMVPSRNELIDWVGKLNLRVIAIHTRALNRLDTISILEFLFSQNSVDLAILGSSKFSNLEENIKVVNDFFE